MKEDNWSTGATWTCSGLLLAAGLTPCILFAVATHHLLWATLLLVTLPVALMPSLYLTLFSGRKDLQLYLGSLYIPAGLWVLLWSFIPETHGWVRDSLVASGCFLIALGLIFLFLFLSEYRDKKKRQEAAAG